MIQTQVADRIATLTFHRPEKLNALSQQLISDSIATLRAWSIDPAVGVVIVTGSGRAFCARLESMLEMRENMHRLVPFLQSFDKPVVAAINGPAVAGGLTLALSCDFR